MIQGVTFDSGMLIALERRKASAWRVYARLRERRSRITIPAAVVGEWWRGRTDLRDAIYASAFVEPLTGPLAQLAGEAIAAVVNASVVDALVMASAARRGDVVYTTDLDDLTALCSFFRGVRVLAI